MKVEKKLIIEVGGDDAKHLQTALEKINKIPEQVGFNKKDNLTPDEIAVIKKLNESF